jgi:hypothetical protein
MNDDFGDRFPGAVPTPAPTARADKRIVRMHAAYAQKANSLVEAGREDLAHELSDTFVEEAAGAHANPRRDAGRRMTPRNRNGRRPGGGESRLSSMGRITRRSLDRFDRYTLDVFNAGSTYRSDHSA